MGAEGGQRLRFVPRIVGEQAAPKPSRQKKLDELSRFIQGQDRLIEAKDKDKLLNHAATYNKQLATISKALKEKKGSLTEDEQKSVVLLRYVTDLIKAMKNPVEEAQSGNLYKIYEACVKAVIIFTRGDYFGRLFSQNEEKFLEIEPLLTICSSICNVSSAGDNVQGILIASFAAQKRSEKSVFPSRENDVIPIAEHWGKPFKDSESIRKAMEEAGSAGIYQELRAEPGFGAYSDEFQEKVAVFEKLIDLGSTKATRKQKKNAKIALKEFRANIIHLKVEAMDYIQLFARPLEPWKAGSEKSERHNMNCTYLYLMDIVERCHEAAEKQDKSGLYGVLASIRQWVTNTLTTQFFKRNMMDLMIEYNDVLEPQLVAFGNKAGVDFPTFVKGVDSQHYKAFEVYETANNMIPAFSKVAKE